jgi:hypothetical protein
MTVTQRGATAPASGVRFLVQAWARFWFRPADPTVLGAIRICCGLIVFYAHLACSYDLRAFFGSDAWLDARMINEFRYEAPTVAPPSGWDAVPLSPQTVQEQAYMNKWGANPRQAAAMGHPLWSMWYHVTDPFQMRLLHAGVLLVMLAFAVGFCTRVTGVLTWLAVLSYIHRAPTALFGMDTMTAVLTLYLMIGSSGAALSVDRLLALYWARRAAPLGPAPKFLRPEPSVSVNLALRLIQVHFCIIYLVAGLSKLQGFSWWSGTAVWGTMANPEFCPQLQLYADLLRLLARHRWLWELVTTGESFFTLAFEVAFAFCVWNRRLRPLFIAGAVLLHVGIALCMGLVTFSILMLTGVFAFVPAEALHALLGRLGDRLAGLRPAGWLSQSPCGTTSLAGSR